MVHTHLVGRESLNITHGRAPAYVHHPFSLAVLFLAVIEHLLHRPVPALGDLWVAHQGGYPWMMPLDVPLDYISRVSFQGYLAMISHA